MASCTALEKCSECDLTVTQALQFGSDGIHALTDKSKRKSYSLAKQHNPLYYSHLYRLLEKCCIFGIALLRIKPGQKSPHHFKKEFRSRPGSQGGGGQGKGKSERRGIQVSDGHALTWEALSGHRHNSLPINDLA